MRLAAKSLFGCIRSLVSARAAFQFRLTLHKLHRLASMTKELLSPNTKKTRTWWKGTQGRSATSAFIY